MPLLLTQYSDTQTMLATKKELRTEYRRLRRSIPRDEFAVMNETIRRRLLAHPAVAGAQTVFSYISFGSEVDTRSAIADLLDAGRTVIAPHSDWAADPLRWFHILRPGDPLLSLKGDEPDKTPGISDAVDIPAVEVFLVPGLVWDHDGYRVGYGGGFFDRLLASAGPDAARIGLAFEVQMIERVPRDPWDIPMDLIVTDAGIHETGSRLV